jgi:hypothetical protein
VTYKTGNCPLCLSRKTKTTTKKGINSAATIQQFCQQHINKLIANHRTDDYVTALMACHHSRKATIWEIWFTPFFFTCVVHGVSVFKWCQPGVNSRAICIDQNPVRSNNLTAPRVPNLGEHMKELLFKLHEEVSTRWGKVMDRMQHTAQYDGNNVLNLPPCITVEEFKQIINYVGKHIYRDPPTPKRRM